MTIGDRDKVFAESEQPAARKRLPTTGRRRRNQARRRGAAMRRQQRSPSIHTSGVVIESVRTGSFADLQGLEPGLVITHVNRQPTATKEQFDAVVGKLKTGDDVVFEVIDPRHPGDWASTTSAARYSSSVIQRRGRSSASGAGIQSNLRFCSVFDSYFPLAATAETVG